MEILAFIEDPTLETAEKERGHPRLQEALEWYGGQDCPQDFKNLLREILGPQNPPYDRDFQTFLYFCYLANTEDLSRLQNLMSNICRQHFSPTAPERIEEGSFPAAGLLYLFFKERAIEDGLSEENAAHHAMKFVVMAESKNQKETSRITNLMSVIGIDKPKKGIFGQFPIFEAFTGEDADFRKTDEEAMKRMFARVGIDALILGARALQDILETRLVERKVRRDIQDFIWRLENYIAWRLAEGAIKASEKSEKEDSEPDYTCFINQVRGYRTILRNHTDPATGRLKPESLAKLRDFSVEREGERREEPKGKTGGTLAFLRETIASAAAHIVAWRVVGGKRPKP